jgi:hypothetical protein
MKPVRTPTNKRRTAALLLAIASALTACSSSLDDRSVREFIDKADDAARKRYAPEICGLRAEEFTQELSYLAMHSDEPAKSTVSRKLWCQEAGKFSRLRQYQLERTSLNIDVAADRKTAKVVAEYKEILPYYDDPFAFNISPDNFREFLVVESRDESIVGIESGDLVFMNARVEAREVEFIKKGPFDLPWVD